MNTRLLLLILGFSTQICLAQTAPKKSGQDQKAGHYIELRGIKIYYEVYGSGEPLLFVHGNGGSVDDFRHQVPFFAKKFKVILADSRAQGKTVDKSDSLSYEMMADDLNALLNHFKIDSCHVVGWSDGGINGLLLAMRHPEKVKKLVATGANLWPDTTALDPWMHKAITTWYDSLSGSTINPKQANERKLLRLMAEQPHIALEDLRQVKCPSLIIGGDHDVILPQHTLLIAQAIPRAYLWIMPNSGHSTLVYYKEDFNRVVMDFLTKPYREIKGPKRLE